jgi:hypothetical protein
MKPLLTASDPSFLAPSICAEGSQPSLDLAHQGAAHGRSPAVSPCSSRLHGECGPRTFADVTMDGVPDDLDYTALGELLEDPAAWSRHDFTTARAILANQWRSIQESDPKDAKTRASLEEVVEQLQAAIDAYVASR